MKAKIEKPIDQALDLQAGSPRIQDRIQGNTIILDGRGPFPKKVLILEPGKRSEYELKQTRNRGYLLN